MKNRNAAKHPTSQDRYIGDRIKEARIALGMTQKDLGELIGVSYQQMQKYETGVNRINGARIEKLISALNRPFNYFYPGATDVRAASDPELTSVLTSKIGQRAVRGFSRIKRPDDQQLAVKFIERLGEEQANG
jgi:transcriptional regulator with XRE-family HTH domain